MVKKLFVAPGRVFPLLETGALVRVNGAAFFEDFLGEDQPYGHGQDTATEHEDR